MAVLQKSLIVLLVLLVLESFAIPIKQIKDGVVYRLPETIVPDSYKIDLILTEANLNNATFSGSVEIGFHLQNENVSTNVVKLHAKDLNITTVTLQQNNETIEINQGPYESDPVTDILTLTTTTTNLTNAQYLLTIGYTGILSTTSMSGFYRSEYMENGTTKYLATTQFEPTNARRAFPCFDEPAFKATFDISISHPEGYMALANQPFRNNSATVDGLNKVEFETTPPMSTYLIAFIVSQFDCTNSVMVDVTIPTRVCSRNGLQHTREWAQNIVPKAIASMENFTGVLYQTGGINKMDVIAIPDFSAGAMENWGLVTYRETALLYDENESSNYYKQRVATVIQHEFAHQWFGDLVTLKWWSEIFLNEGFATLFEYHAASEIEELRNWELPQQFVVEEVQGALEIDDTESSKPLSYNVEIPDDISDRFDSISYSKGGSILKMVEHILTTDVFKAGLNAYLEAFNHSNTDSNDLWSTLGEQATDQLPPNVNFSTVMDSWTHKAGYPVITVSANGDNVTITQKRFLRSNTVDNTTWYVPISYYTSNDTTIDTQPKFWLTPNEDGVIPNVLSGIDWIIFNTKQSGYYRVNYDDTLWNRISTVLNTNLTKIDVLNRAQIVDDLFNFAKANLTNYSTVFDFIRFLQNDTDYYPWSAGFRGFTTILQRTNRAEIRTELINYISNLTANLYNSVPFNQQIPDNQVYSLKQALALDWACRLGNSDCVNNSVAQLTNYIINTTKPSPNLRSTVYCYGLRYSNNSGSDWAFLWQKYLETPLATEQVTILTSLGCTTNATLLIQYLNLAIANNSQIRIQDVTRYVFRPIYTNTPVGVDVMIDFITNNHQEIVQHFGSASELRSLITSLGSYVTNQDQINKLQQLRNRSDLDDNVKKSINATLTTISTNQEFTNTLESQLVSYFQIDDDDDNDGGNDNDGGDSDNGAKINSLSIVVVFVTLFIGFYQMI